MRKIFLLLFAVLLASCATQKKVVYLQDREVGVAIDVIEGGEIRLQPNDVVSIYVSSKNPELATIFNQMSVSYINSNSYSNMSNTRMSDAAIYTIDEDGYIDFPVFGRIKIVGMTKSELAKSIKTQIIESDQIKDPIVTVEFENLSFSVMGDVADPGNYNITKNKTTIFEALSMSGDLAITGKRNKVVVIRKNEDQLMTYELDLRNADVYQSPAYFVHQNDVIYIEPNTIKSNQSTVNGNTLRSTSFWMSLASFLTTIVLLIVN